MPPGSFLWQCVGCVCYTLGPGGCTLGSGVPHTQAGGAACLGWELHARAGGLHVQAGGLHTWAGGAARSGWRGCTLGLGGAARLGWELHTQAEGLHARAGSCTLGLGGCTLGLRGCSGTWCSSMANATAISRYSTLMSRL